MKLIRIVLPVIITVLLEIYILNKSKKKSKCDDERKKPKDESYISEGMAIGMCLGTATGIAFDIGNVAIGMSIGMLIGMNYRK